jgi:hypothetical protein
VAKKEKKRFESYYLEIRTVKNSENFTMALIQCEILHLIVKSLFFIFWGGFFFKISILEVENGKNGPGILRIKKLVMWAGPEFTNSRGPKISSM